MGFIPEFPEKPQATPQPTPKPEPQTRDYQQFLKDFMSKSTTEHPLKKRMDAVKARCANSGKDLYEDEEYKKVREEYAAYWNEQQTAKLKQINRQVGKLNQQYCHLCNNKGFSFALRGLELVSWPCVCQTRAWAKKDEAKAAAEEAEKQRSKKNGR